MSDKRKSGAGAAITVALVALVFMLGMAYVASYFALSHLARRDGPAGRTYRVYDAEWMVLIYRPAAHVESLITGTDTNAIVWPDD